MSAIGFGFCLSPRLRRRAKPFDPASLFAAGEHGAWFDVSDLSTLFQDSAGTVAAAVDSPVGRVLDKSGRGNHATQATAAARPTLRQDSGGRLYLEFDGTDDILATPSLALAMPWDRISALNQISYTAGDHFFASTGNLSGGRLRQSGTAPAINIRASLDGPGSSALAVGANGVLTERFDSAASRIAVNGGAYANGDVGTATLDGLIVGRRENASGWANFRLYGLIMRAGTMSDSQITKAKAHLAARSGVAL